MHTLRLKDHLEKLYPFKVIAETKGLTAAAKVLGLSQSSLSHTMKALEDILEVQLLKRHPRGIVLTHEGEILYEFSKNIFHQSDDVELQIKNIKQPFAGVLKVSTHEVLATHAWPNFIQALGIAYPHLQIVLMSGRINAIMDDVFNGNVDIALTVEPQSNPKLTKLPLYDSELGFYVAHDAKNLKSFTCLKKKSVHVNELDGIPILTDSHANIKQGVSMNHYLSMAGLKSKNSFTLNSFEAAINLCAVGAGIAAIPKMVAKHAVAGKKIRELKVTNLNYRPFGRSTIHMSYLKASSNRMIGIFEAELLKFLDRKG